MLKKLKIVLPVTLEGDADSVTSAAEDNSQEINSAYFEYGNSDDIDTGKNQVHVNIVTSDSILESSHSISRPATSTPDVDRRPRRDSANQSCRNNNENSQNQNYHRQKQYLQSQKQCRHVPQQERKAPLPQTQHQISNGDWNHELLVIQDKNSWRVRPSTAAPPSKWQQRLQGQGDVRVSVTDAYDVDLEYRDIMMKALKSYTQHYRCEKTPHGNSGNVNDDYRLSSVFNNLISGSQRTSYSNDDINTDSRLVKMSQCRLRFYDDDADKGTQIHNNPKLKTSSLPHNSPLLYTLEDGDGVLADAMGHVYRSTQTRPWSALPGKICDLVKVKRQGLHLHGNKRYQDTTRKNNIGSPPHNRNNVRSSTNFKLVTLTLSEEMSQPISHSMAYQRRNQTTHMWTDSSQLMSQSVPAANFFHRNFGSSSSSPRFSRDDTSGLTSPAGKATKARPSSSYSYDGGFFLGAHSGQAEYFVIHPDWVSEAVGVKKLPLSDKKAESPLQRSLSLRFRSLPDGRRCLSAPPKQRNPITMDHMRGEPADKTSK